MLHISRLPVYVSLLGGLLLHMLPWSGLLLLAKPDFVLLLLIFWLLRAPFLCNIGTAWLAGLIMDVANGGLLGQTALAYALTAFIAITYQRRLTLFNIWQQAGYVFGLLCLTQLVMLVLKLFAGGISPGWVYFLPCVTGIALWLSLLLARMLRELPANNK